MGFLLGIANRLNTGRAYRAKQAELVAIQRRIRQVGKEYSQMEKMINAQKRNEINSIKAYYSTMSNSMMLGQQAIVGGQTLAQAIQASGKSEADFYKDSGNQTLINSFASAQSQLNTQMSQANANIQAQQQQQLANIESYYENMTTMLLDPIKDEEDDLQAQKDTLEAEMELYKNDYEASKDMISDGSKHLMPSYTGGGGRG